MSVCPNCGTKLGCGCERRLSVTGKRCCKKCVTAENAKAQQAVPKPGIAQPTR